jgi:hypothetical protein
MSTTPPEAPDYRAITNLQAYSKLDTSALFFGAPPNIAQSPIDQFLLNTEAINKIFLAQATTASSIQTGPPPESPEVAAAVIAEDASGASHETLGDAKPHDSPDLNEISEPVLTSAPISLSSEFSALVVLGYMSAVESYFRALVRGLIHVDYHVKKLAEPMTISFAAALHCGFRRSRPGIMG